MPPYCPQRVLTVSLSSQNTPQSKTPLPARLPSCRRPVHLAYLPLFVPATTMLPLPIRLPELPVRSSSRRLQPHAHQAESPNCAYERIQHSHRHYLSNLPVNEVSPLGSMTTPPHPTCVRDQ
jgi:hypothetical protein